MSEKKKGKKSNQVVNTSPSGNSSSDDKLIEPKGVENVTQIDDGMVSEESVGNIVTRKARRAAGKVTNVVKVPVQKVATGLGISNGVAGILLALIIAAFGGTGGMMFSNYQYEQKMMRQEIIYDCKEDVDAIKKSATTNENLGDEDAMRQANAEKIWGVMKAIGCTDEQAAGALGNMQQESDLDSTAIENIAGEYGDITGPKKSAAAGHAGQSRQEAASHLSAYAVSSTINLNQWYKSEAGYCPGIGLPQFTGPEGDNLMKWAEAAGTDWWEMDYQLAFMITDYEHGGFGAEGQPDHYADWLLRWAQGNTTTNNYQDASTPEKAAEAWNYHYEWNVKLIDQAPRSKYAREWFTKLGGTMGDEAYAQSILELAEQLGAGGFSKATKKAEEECEGADEDEPDNSDLARAAVAYAWETTDMGRGNNGTELFQAVHDAVYPGDPYYQSCDRGVACAVRWAGADDEFPAGDTDMQDAYCSSGEGGGQWEKVGEFDSMGVDSLEPGDILITTRARRGSQHGHIVMYVSNEIVQEKYPGSDASFVSASYMTRSPGCETYSGQFVGDGYYVYRLKEYEPNSQYKDCVAGRNLSDR